jgi:protein TonB
MELKKSVKADLEWRKPTFLQIGLFVSLLVVFLAFEYVGASDITQTFEGVGDLIIDDEQIIQTQEQKVEPPPPAQENIVTSVIEIVKDDIKVADFEISSESFEDAVASEVVYIEQTTEVVKEPEPIFQIVEELPEFTGGDAARIKFLTDNIVYPRQAKEAGLEGTVLVTFVVEPDGSISNVQILRGKAPLLDDEAIRVTKLMPKWKPGKQRGKAVRVQYRMPITFSLYD